MNRGCPWTVPILSGHRTKEGRSGPQSGWRLADHVGIALFPKSCPSPWSASRPPPPPRSPTAPMGSKHRLSAPPPFLSSVSLLILKLTQEFYQFVLSLHRLDLSLIFSLILFNPRPTSIFRRSFKKLTVMDRILREFSTMWLLAMIVEGSIRMIKLPTSSITTLVEINLAILLSTYMHPSLPFTSRSKLKSSPLRLNSKSSSDPRELFPFGIIIM